METITNIIKTLNNIYKKQNPKGTGEFQVECFSNTYVLEHVEYKEIRLEFTFIKRHEDPYIILQFMYKIRLSEWNEDIIMNNIYSQFLEELIRFMLFAKDTDNLRDSENNPLCIKFIQTLIRKENGK